MSWLDIYLLSLSIGISGVVWINYLLDPDGLLSFFPVWLDRFFYRINGNSIYNCEVSCQLTFRQQMEYKIKWVLTQCEKCFAGQLGFWVYVIMKLQSGGYEIGEHLLITFLSIFFAGTINTILRKLQ